MQKAFLRTLRLFLAKAPKPLGPPGYATAAVVRVLKYTSKVQQRFRNYREQGAELGCPHTLKVFNFLVNMATAACVLPPASRGGVGEVNVAILAVELGHFQKTSKRIMRNLQKR